MRVRVDEVFIGTNRMRRERDVSELASSMKDRGQLQPIVIDQRNRLVFGRHRLEAAKMLGWETIEAERREYESNDERRLAEIDENLIRHDLTALERVEHVAERYRLLERMGMIKGRGRPTKKALESGAFSVAEVGTSLGLGGSTVRWFRSMDEGLSHAAKDCIRGSRMEDNLSEIERIAKMEDIDRLAVLYSLEEEKAAGKQLISGGVREIQRRMKRAETKRLGLEAGDVENGPYRTIVIDPPWSPEISGECEGPNGKISPPYEVWSLDRISNLPLASWETEGDTHLYLWCTNATLPHALQLLEGWGYTYHQPLVWVKDRPTSWRYYQNRNELCLFATKGTRLLAEANASNIIHGDRAAHSTKPEAFYELVERCSAGPRLELFARRKREGWASWGAEVDPRPPEIEAPDGEPVRVTLSRVVASGIPFLVADTLMHRNGTSLLHWLTNFI